MVDTEKKDISRPIDIKEKNWCVLFERVRRNNPSRSTVPMKERLIGINEISKDQYERHVLYRPDLVVRRIGKE